MDSTDRPMAHAAEALDDEPPEPRRLTVWKITGEACTDSTGGIETYYVLTDSNRTPPEPQAALDMFVRAHGCLPRSWYQIDHVERIGELSTVFDAGNHAIDAALRTLLAAED